MSRESFGDRFWNVICDYEKLVRLALAFDVAVLILLLISLPGVRPGTPAYYILVVDFLIAVPLLAVTGFTIWRCQRHYPGKRF